MAATKEQQEAWVKYVHQRDAKRTLREQAEQGTIISRSFRLLARLEQKHEQGATVDDMIKADLALFPPLEFSLQTEENT